MISRIHPTCFLFVFSLRSHKQVKIVYLVNTMFDTIKNYFVSAVLRVRTKIASRSRRLSFLRPC